MVLAWFLALVVVLAVTELLWCHYVVCGAHIWCVYSEEVENILSLSNSANNRHDSYMCVTLPGFTRRQG